VILVPLADWRRHEGLAELRTAFEFLEQHADGAGLEDGRHEIDGARVYALVMTFQPKPLAEGRFETHHNHVDVIYLISGAEMIGHGPRAMLGPERSYDEQKDVGFYDTPEEYVRIPMRKSGLVCVFYPEDGHMPFCRLDEDGPARKVVVKVAVTRP
jgi:biofilm protein TabA